MKTSKELSRISENQLTKLYYTIGEVAKMFDVNTSLIRFWEKEFPGISPKKNKKGNRVFTPKDVMLIDEIYFLVKEQGYTLEGAKNALKQGNVESSDTHLDSSVDVVLNKLERIKDKLVRLKA